MAGSSKGWLKVAAGDKAEVLRASIRAAPGEMAPFGWDPKRAEMPRFILLHAFESLEINLKSVLFLFLFVSFEVGDRHLLRAIGAPTGACQGRHEAGDLGAGPDPRLDCQEAHRLRAALERPGDLHLSLKPCLKGYRLYDIEGILQQMITAAHGGPRREASRAFT